MIKIAFDMRTWKKICFENDSDYDTEGYNKFAKKKNKYNKCDGPMLVLKHG